MSALANEHKAINLSQGFPNFDCSEKLKKLVSKYIDKGYNQYAPMAGVPLLRERIAEKIEAIYGPVQLIQQLKSRLPREPRKLFLRL